MEAEHTQLLRGAEEAARRVASTLEVVDEARVREPSLLPGWTRAHVLAHLVGNAQALGRLAEGAQTGTPAEMYPGGREARNAEIEQLAAEPHEALVQRVRESADNLGRMWQELPATGWHAQVRLPGGREGPLWKTLWKRWRELDVHHFDLDLGYGPYDWPSAFVERALPELAGTLAHRTPQDQQVALVDVDGVRVSNDAAATVEVHGPRAWLVAWLTGRPVSDEVLHARSAAGAPAAIPQLAPWV